MTLNRQAFKWKSVMLGVDWITAIDIESIQGQDFEWIYGSASDFPN